jgi:hypothetical protein
VKDVSFSLLDSSFSLKDVSSLPLDLSRSLKDASFSPLDLSNGLAGPSPSVSTPSSSRSSLYAVPVRQSGRRAMSCAPSS